MGNRATRQETCDAVCRDKFENKSSDFFYDPLASFRVNNGAPIKSLKKTCYSKAKTVWPLPNHELPFFPEFPIKSVTSEHSFNVISVVSSGAYGKVLHVVHKEEAKNYAMKVLSKNMIFKENLVQQVKVEAQIQVMCDHHPFLVRGPFRWQNKRNLFIVTEFIEGGDLQQLWQDTGCFHEDLIKIYVAEIALVLDFLHNAGIIYRDLKMENLLIDGNGHLKLIDFGLSKWLSHGDRCHTLCGTRQYMAPEILRLESYTHAVDWWSLGVLFYALLRGKLPFFGNSEVPAARETPLDFSDDDMNGGSSASESARRLIRGLLTVDALKRVRSLRTLKNHAFYHHFDFESLRSKKNKRGRGQHGGKKHGAGNKGSGQRQNFMRLGYETGNNPFYLRVPKEPYYKGHHLRREYPPISLMQLQTLIDTGRLDTSKPIDLSALCNTKLFQLSPLENQYGFQLTDEGLDNFKGRVNIEVQYASEQVIATIERNGGVITTAFYDAPSLIAMRDPMKFFASGNPIPKRQMPPENAVEYYTDPKNRGYLADPDLIALERFKLAQKYGYELPDLKKDPELLPMMLERKDPRQIFFGLNPGWLVNLKDKKIFEPEDEQLLEYFRS